jgi:hypothetical protein
VTTPLWALEWYDPAFTAMRGAAAVGGAVIGWFLAGPACRLLVRAAFHKPTPPLAIYPARIGGAVVLGCLIFYYLPLGFGGSGGWGLGPGPGPGGGKGSTGNASNGTAKNSATHQEDPSPRREVLEIELIGGGRYKGDGKFYLLHRKEPPVTIREVEDYFQENKGRLEVHIVLTSESVGQSHVAVQRLRNLADKYKMVTRMVAP